jgi:Na+-transporting NADH:ubiquinone oxidoreductase subunit A
MVKQVNIKKGVDIKLKGEAEKLYEQLNKPKSYAIKPADFASVRLKLKVREGDEVLAGDTIMFDKDRPDIIIPAPVSGEIVEVVRGAKRKILEIRILPDSEIKYKEVSAQNPQDLSAEAIKENLIKVGAWAHIRQRPYNIIANPDVNPRDIFITCFDSAPLSADSDFVVHGQEESFKAGVEALKKLTKGKVYLGVDGKVNPAKAFSGIKEVEVFGFTGPHPAGNVGVQIHHIKPINKGETVWGLNYQDVLIIGRVFTEGRYNATRHIAVAGSQVKKPRYHKVLLGASIKNFISDNVKPGKSRYISGNVLTGSQISPDGYLGFYDQAFTVIPEGGEEQFFGWLTPNFNKFSISRTLFSWLSPEKKLKLDASMNGEERAFVVTGEYEKVFPFDIFPVQLLKSIMIKDIEAMENLGIYEVAEEDFALCEVICTSKIPVQQTVREGLDLMVEELGS